MGQEGPLMRTESVKRGKLSSTSAGWGWPGLGARVSRVLKTLNRASFQWSVMVGGRDGGETAGGRREGDVRKTVGVEGLDAGETGVD